MHLLHVTLRNLLALGLWAGYGLANAAGAPTAPGWAVLGPDGVGVQRWVSSAAQCPVARWASGRQEVLSLRAAPGRPGDATLFADRVCEITWPRDESSVVIEGVVFPSPYKPSYRRIALLGDTGCRRKAADNAYQDCDDASAWPFAAIAESVRAQHPDLVVHVGDITYRESPCPEGIQCKDPAWGYGADVWSADLLQPAAGLLQAAPWVFVRGNHETCERAGLGWFRYLDPRPYVEGQSCDAPQSPRAGNFTPPYRIDLGARLQLIVLDSAASGNKSPPGDAAPELAYVAQLERVRTWLSPARYSWIASHHPFLAMAPSPGGEKIAPGNSKVLSKALDAYGPASLLESGVRGFLHGHIHAFEALDFDEALPVSLVVGNSGSQMEGRAPQSVPAGFALKPQVHVAHYASQPRFGFALFELSPDAPDDVTLTEFSVEGQALLRCKARSGHLQCSNISS